jgi:hypothetical protein
MLKFKQGAQNRLEDLTNKSLLLIRGARIFWVAWRNQTRDKADMISRALLTLALRLP